MAIFQITGPAPNAFLFDVMALTNGTVLVPIFENAEGSTSRFGALKFALYGVNEVTGQAEQIGSTRQVLAEFPANFRVGAAPLQDGGFVILLTRSNTDITQPEQTTFIRYDATGAETGRSDLAANYSVSPDFNTSTQSEQPLGWVINNSTRQLELLSPETGLPTTVLDAHVGNPLLEPRGLDGGMILRTNFDPEGLTLSFAADWIDNAITDPAPVFAAIARPLGAEFHVAGVGNQIVVASETLIFPDDRDEIDLSLKVQMLLPGAATPVTVLDEFRRNEASTTIAVELAEIPGIGFAYVRVMSSAATRRVTEAELMVFDFSGERLFQKALPDLVGLFQIRNHQMNIVPVAGTADNHLDLMITWPDDPDPLLREHAANVGDTLRLTVAELGDLTHLGTEFDDFLRGLGGQDSLFGGFGDDELEGGGGRDSLSGGDGNDSLSGDGGDDVIEGGADNDVLFGGDGNDRLVGGSGPDALAGGTGNDTLVSDDGGDLGIGMEGDDVLFGGGGNDTFSGNEGNDVLQGDDGADALDGDEGDDTISGDAGNDDIDGGAGNDLIVGGKGRDSLFGEDGDDRLDGGAGNDLMSGNAGHDRISGGSGADAIVGETGNDTIRGGDGGDLIVAGEDDDDVFGGAGNDTMEGNDGADALQGDGGHDEVDGQLGDDTLGGGTGNDTLFGGEENDVLFGGAGRDRLFGDEGVDELSGDRGRDMLFGGDGNDVLLGGADNDTLVGGAGSDALSGEAGADVFRFRSLSDSTPDAPDVLLDFVHGADRIDLSVLDARNNRPGNNAFSFIGTDGFSGKSGELRVKVGPDGVVVEADRNGDRRADFRLLLEDVSRLEASDFIL